MSARDNEPTQVDYKDVQKKLTIRLTTRENQYIRSRAGEEKLATWARRKLLRGMEK